MSYSHTSAILAIVTGTAFFVLSGCGPSVNTNYSSSSSSSGSSSNTTLPTGLGYTWTSQTSGTTANFMSICFGNGRWVAVGRSGGSGVIASSTDGVSWSLTQETDYHYSAMSDATFGNNTYVAVANFGILYSGDGVTWGAASISTPDPSTYPQQMTAAVYGNGLWVGVDNLFLTDNGWGILTSTDGASWNEAIVTGSYAQPTAITYGNGLYVIVGYGGLVLTSPDAQSNNWTNESLSSGDAIMSIVFVNGQFVAVTNSGDTLISTDAVHWTTYSDNNAYPNGVAYGGGVYLILGTLTGGTVEVSADGQTWTDDTPALPGSLSNLALYSAAYGNGKFVAVGSGGEIGTSQ